MKIWAVCKDPGGTNGVLPVVKSLRGAGHEVLLIANGKAVQLLKDKEDHVVYDSAEEVLKNHPLLPNVCITSMCSNGGVGRDLTPLLRGKCPVVALQDFWGASLRDGGEAAWGDVKYRPDYLVVNDEIGKKIVLDTWSDYKSQQVIVTGYPALDKYKDIKVAEVSAKVRLALGITEKKPVVLFGGQGPGTAETLSELVEALNEVHRDCYFVPRPHPRCKDNFPEEMQPWQEALARLRVGNLVFDFFSQTDTPSLLAASDLVISMSSTILVEAATLNKQNISVLYEDTGMAEFRSSTGLNEFPLVDLGCSAKAVDRKSLRKLLEKSFDNALGLEDAQRKSFRLDGKNAKRVAIFIAALK